MLSQRAAKFTINARDPRDAMGCLLFELHNSLRPFARCPTDLRLAMACVNAARLRYRGLPILDGSNSFNRIDECRLASAQEHSNHSTNKLVLSRVFR